MFCSVSSTGASTTWKVYYEEFDEPYEQWLERLLEQIERDEWQRYERACWLSVPAPPRLRTLYRSAPRVLYRLVRPPVASRYKRQSRPYWRRGTA